MNVTTSFNNDGIDDLARGLLLYLAEVDEYRNLCLQFEASATVRTQGECLVVCRRYRGRDAAYDRLRASVERLPNGMTSVFWATQRRQWERVSRRMLGSLPRRVIRRSFRREVNWQGRCVLLLAHESPDAAVVTVELVLLPLPLDLQEPPLRIVADALRCHAYLMPDAEALAVDDGKPARTGVTIREYLSRTAHQNTYAGQCIPAPGLEA
jgi:hypothetical protein